MQLQAFIDFVKLREPAIDFENPRVIVVFQDTYKSVELYVKRLAPYLDSETYDLLIFNLWLHEYIVSGFDADLYRHYDIDSKAMIINSASNSGSSTSIQSFKSLEEGRFMLMDLWRTPYGRQAYAIMESLQGVVMVRL